MNATLPPLARSERARAEVFREIKEKCERAQELFEEAEEYQRADPDEADRLYLQARAAERQAQDLLLCFPEVRYWPWRDEQQKRQDLASMVWEVVRP